MPGSDLIFEEYLEITENRNLKVVLSQAPLTKVNENFVPMLFHTTRSVLDQGHTQFSDYGRVIAYKSFSDNKEIYSEEGLDLYNTGVFYETGTTESFNEQDLLGLDVDHLNTKVDLKKALYYYKESAEMGYPPAMFNLAAFYEHGMGCDTDLEEVVKWYLAATQAGYVPAYYKLSEMYHYGKGGLEANENKALELLMDAAENGYMKAEYQIGLRYLYDDLPLEVDLEKAEMYFRRAASKGHPDAYYYLAKVFNEKLTEDGKNDVLIQEIISYVLTAADLGNEQAINIVNDLEEKQNDPNK
jgi:TPR repeat protein